MDKNTPLSKLWKTTISVLLPPENSYGAMTPLTVESVFHSLPKTIHSIV
jgi:hypothetical protein